MHQRIPVKRGSFEIAPSAVLTCAPVVSVRRTGSGKIVGDLCPIGMGPFQCSGQRDAGAGDQCACRVRMSERCVEGHRGGAEPPDGGYDGCFRVRNPCQ